MLGNWLDNRGICIWEVPYESHFWGINLSDFYCASSLNSHSLYMSWFTKVTNEWDRWVQSQGVSSIVSEYFYCLLTLFLSCLFVVLVSQTKPPFKTEFAFE